MNKTVFIMDGSGNAVQWAAGMSLRVCWPDQVEARRDTGATVLSWHNVSPHDCVSHFVRALCACPDGSLLEWDKERGVVGCKTWAAVPESVEPKHVEEAAPVAESDGVPEGWRELGADEIISDGDLMHSMGMFCDSYPAQSSIGFSVGKWYGLACSKYASPTGKVWRKVESPAPVDTPDDGAVPAFVDGLTCVAEPKSPALLPDGRPIIPVPGHKKWRELYNNEVIQEGDRTSALDVFGEAGYDPAFVGFSVIDYRMKGSAVPYGKAYRRIKPKKQKAGEGQP